MFGELPTFPSTFPPRQPCGSGMLWPWSRFYKHRGGALGKSLPGSLPQRLRISQGEMSRDVSAWGKSAGCGTKGHRLGRNNRPFLGLEIQAEDTGRVGLSVHSEGSERRRCSQPASLASPCPCYHPPLQPSRCMILWYFVQDAGLIEL